MVEVRHYVSPAGRDIFDEWLSQLPDLRAQVKIAVRIDRLAAGNAGDCKALRGELRELRIDWDRAIEFLRDGRQRSRAAAQRWR